MAVTITSPQSAVVARGSFTLSWTHDYPQARYEVLYRKKGDVNWSTFGQVSGTATSINVDCSVFPDFVEYQYRVIVYSEYADTTETTYSGSDASAAYAVVVVPASQVGKMKAKYGSGMIEVPLYSTVQSGSEKISMKASSTSQPSTNMLTDAQSQQFGSKIRAADGSGNRPIPHQATASDLTNPGQPAYHYMVERSTYYTYYYLPAYYKYTPAMYSEYYNYIPPYYKYTAAEYNYYSYDIINNYTTSYYRYYNAYEIWLEELTSYSNSYLYYRYNSRQYMIDKGYDSVYRLDYYAVFGSYWSTMIKASQYRYLSSYTWLDSDDKIQITIYTGIFRHGMLYCQWYFGRVNYANVYASGYYAIAYGYRNYSTYLINTAYYAYTAPLYYYNSVIVTPESYAYTPAIETNPIHYIYNEV